MIEVSFMSRAVAMVKDWYMAETKGDASCAGLYKRRVLLIEVTTLTSLAEDGS